MPNSPSSSATITSRLSSKIGLVASAIVTALILDHAALLLVQDELFVLVTDQGFLAESRVVWETLSGVDGDSHFVDAFFHSAPPKPDVHPEPTHPSRQMQIDKESVIDAALHLDESRRVNNCFECELESALVARSGAFWNERSVRTP